MKFRALGLPQSKRTSASLSLHGGNLTPNFSFNFPTDAAPQFLYKLTFHLGPVYMEVGVTRLGVVEK